MMEDKDKDVIKLAQAIMPALVWKSAKMKFARSILTELRWRFFVRLPRRLEANIRI